MAPTEVSAIVRSTYEQLSREMEEQPYSDDERRLMTNDNYYYGRFLRADTRHYAMESVVWNVARAIRYLGLDEPAAELRVVDIGSGLGMNSIIFAALGARVLGIDLDRRAVDLATKRVSWFEQVLGRPLAIEYRCGNFADLDLSPWRGMLDRAFSMSAFSYITPLRGTVKRMAELLNGQGRAFIWDTNPDWLFLKRLRPSARDLPSPGAVAGEFRRVGFDVDVVGGGVAVPSAFWRSPALRPAVAWVNRVARRSHRLSISFVLGARRRQAEV